MSNIILTEKEIKILLMNSLQQVGIELEDIIFKQKVQLFGQGRGIEINAELVRKKEENEITALLNKLTYQQDSHFTPVSQPAQTAVQPVTEPMRQPMYQTASVSQTAQGMPQNAPQGYPHMAFGQVITKSPSQEPYPYIQPFNYDQHE